MGGRWVGEPAMWWVALAIISALIIAGVMLWPF